MKRSSISLAVLLAVGMSVRGQDSSAEERKFAEEAAALAKANKFDEAIAAMKKAVALAPRNDLFLATLSQYEFRAKKFADGLEHARLALKLNDKVGDYHVLVAGNAIGNQDLDVAGEHADIILKREKEFGPGAANAAREIKRMLAPTTFTLHWKLDPRKGRATAGTFAVALPRGRLPYQEVTFEIDGVGSQRLVKGPVNDVLYVTPKGKEAFSLTTKVTVKPYSFKKELARVAPGQTLPAEARAYLGSGNAINVRSPVLAKVAAGLKGKTAVETVRNILAWMKKNVDYKLDRMPISKLDFESVDEIIKRGHAECRGYAMLFTALCRAAGVPARPLWGLLRVPKGVESKVGDIASHNWAEFYVAGVGWVPVDPQHPETLGFMPTNIIRIYMDEKKAKKSLETLPILNLVYMNGDRIQFDESP